MCAICYNSTSCTSTNSNSVSSTPLTLHAMPCCGASSNSSASTTSLVACEPCLRLLAADYRGICPFCRKRFEIVRSSSVLIPFTVREIKPVPPAKKQCSRCRQQHVLFQNTTMCQNCNLGTRYSFRYQCKRCLRTQRIAHPMWLYQTRGHGESECIREFTGPTWACHQGCGTFTQWRIVEDEVQRVPVEHRPREWDEVRNLLEEVRGRRGGQ